MIGLTIGTNLKVTPKSRKGHNKIHEGLGSDVVVIQLNHPSNPPAVMVAPVFTPTMASNYVRWIRISDDPDFSIVKDSENE